MAASSPARSAALSALLALAALAAPAAAQAPRAEPPLAAPIEPDRPDVANSATTVPPGAVQLETGIEYARTRAGGEPDERRLAAQATLRVGLTDRLEARLEGEPLVRLRGPEDDTGHGDLAVGVKYRFLDAADPPWRPALGVLPFVKVPVAGRPIGTGRPDVGLLGLASLELPWEMALDVNAGLAAVGQRPDGYLLQALAAASLQREILPRRLQVFAELFYASRDEREGRGQLGADTGLIYRLAPQLALDAAVETSLAGDGPDYALRAGLSVRFGR